MKRRNFIQAAGLGIAGFFAGLFGIKAVEKEPDKSLFGSVPIKGCNDLSEDEIVVLGESPPGEWLQAMSNRREVLKEMDEALVGQRWNANDDMDWVKTEKGLKLEPKKNNKSHPIPGWPMPEGWECSAVNDAEKEEVWTEITYKYFRGK